MKTVIDHYNKVKEEHHRLLNPTSEAKLAQEQKFTSHRKSAVPIFYSTKTYMIISLMLSSQRLMLRIYKTERKRKMEDGGGYQEENSEWPKSKSMNGHYIDTENIPLVLPETMTNLVLVILWRDELVKKIEQEQISRGNVSKLKTSKQASMVQGDKHDHTSSSASVREQGNISLQCPKLTETNYTTWALLMETILKAHGLWKTIDTKDAVDEKKAHTSKAMIFQILPEDVLMQVAQCSTTKEV
ncbi:zinc finger, CCHC-type containing protein, partial [Tanacetum coccineum]